MQIESRVNILLVDDYPENLLALEAILEPLGENLVRATSGEEALKCLLQQDFAVILLDVMMPELNGFETAALIRKRQQSRYTPIIFLTAFSKNDAFVSRGYSVGAVDYLPKPIQPKVLFSKVVVFVDLFKKTRKVQQQAAQLAAVNAQLSNSEARFQAFMNNAPTIAFMKTAEDGRYVYVNRPYEQTFKKKLTDVHGKTDFEIWPQEYAKQLRDNDQALLKNKTSTEVVERIPTPDGNLHYWLVFKFLVTNGQQQYIGGVAVEITERLKAEEALRASEGRYRLVVQGVRDYAIYMLDPSGYVVSWNAGAEVIKGYTAEEIIGQNFSCFYPAEDIQQGLPERNLQSAVAEGNYETQGWRVRKDGTTFWADITLASILNETGKIGCFVKVTRDITLRKASEEAMKTHTQKLEQSNQELSDFARAASHDLQEPLRKIQVFGDRLCDRGLVVPEGQSYLERIQDTTKRMSTVIQDLLALSLVTTKVQPFKSVELTKLLQDSISDLEIRIEEVGGTVELGTLPSINADPLKMQQLFQNLISNALKFRRLGVAPVVRVWGQCTPQECEFIVADNGIGFDEKYKERIFNVFERLHSYSDYEGTGVGLAICRRIVEQHGGTIVAKSTQSQGATFTITLPNIEYKP